MTRAGQAGEVGSVFRCAVATHLAVHGMRSRSVSGLDLPDGADPIRLDFETSDPTDDIRVTFSDGRRAYVSAKRKVNRGKPLRETVTGWIEQTSALGPDDLLVVAGEDLVGPIKDLDTVLRRHRAGLRMETQAEHNAFSALSNLLPEKVRELVLNRARILHLPDSTGRATSTGLLAALMDWVVADAQGQRAVTTLNDLFHRQAGEALGSGIDDWVMALNSASVPVIADQGGPAGMRTSARLAAVAAYYNRLKEDAGRVDLSLLADDLPAITIDGLIDGLRIDVDDSRTPDDLLPHIRRWRRLLIVGQPGSGKSVALREIAAHCASHPHAPVPIRTSLPRLMKRQHHRLTIDGIIDGAVTDAVSEEQRQPLAGYLTGELAKGHAIVLCDGLDECGPRAPWAAQQLANILGSLHPRTGFVLATRANAQIPAARLGLPRVELAPPQDLSETVDGVLVACANTRVRQHDRETWLATRRAWIRDAKDEHEDLLTVPLLAILLALICASASDADLPKGRAALLHRAVEQSVHRWEQSREALDATRPWSPTLTTAMLLRGFIVLGRILDGDATPPRTEAVESISEILKDPQEWDMPPAQAYEVAEQVLRFWDEHVAVFVVNAAEELTTRSKVFSEIATAMWARRCGRKDLRSWLSEALQYTDSDGAIALAAGLDSRTTTALLEVGAGGRPEATLMVADLLDRKIVSLDEGELGDILDQLKASIVASRKGGPSPRRGPRNPPTWAPTLWDETRDPGPWPFVQAACLLALPDKCRRQRRNLIGEATLDDRSEMMAKALCELTDATTDSRALGKAGAAAVNAALAIPLPPESELVPQSRRRVAFVGGGCLAPGLAQIALAAAGRLNELAQGSGDRALEIAMRTPPGTASGIMRALTKAGIDTSRRWGSVGERMRSWLSALDKAELALLDDLSSLADPSSSEQDEGFWSLTDVGDLLTATGYQQVGIREIERAVHSDGQEIRRAWFDAIADAYGIEKPAVAAQAKYLQERSEGAANIGTFSDDWMTASTKPLVDPLLSGNLNNALTPAQLLTLQSCLEADSDWIAWAAGAVLANVEKPPRDSRNLFVKDMSSWPRHRAGLLYMVAILAAGHQRTSMLACAASSDSGDYRYAAQRTLSIAPELDPEGTIWEALVRDPDMSVRPDDARNAQPAPTYWSCSRCRAFNDLDLEDCPECTSGVRPDA